MNKSAYLSSLESQKIYLKITCMAMLLGLLLHVNCFPMYANCGMGGMGGHQKHETNEPVTENKKLINFRFGNYSMKITCTPYPILTNSESKLDIVLSDINNSEPVGDTQIELIIRKNDSTNINLSDEVVNHKVWTKNDGSSSIDVSMPEVGSFSFEFQIMIENKTFSVVTIEEVKENSQEGHKHDH